MESLIFMPLTMSWTNLLTCVYSVFISGFDIPMIIILIVITGVLVMWASVLK